MIKKPIFVALSPNTQKDDIFLASKLLFQPWKWKRGKDLFFLEKELKKYLKTKYIFLFNSGRSALIAILDALNIKKGDEILVQAFTCNAVINPILKIKAKPVFVDIDETLNLDPKDLKKKITPHSKAVIIQHTFGYPAKIKEILKITKEYNLSLIEDCAHSLGAKYEGKFCGTFGKASFFSFGRDKVISSVFGGIAITNDDRVGENLKNFYQKLNFPSFFWTFQQLLHPILTNILVFPAFTIHSLLGKIVLKFFQKISLLSKAVFDIEKKGGVAKYFPKKMPNALAILALNQFKKLEKFNYHRKKISQFYTENLKEKFIFPFLKKNENNLSPIYMRFPIFISKNSSKIIKKAEKEKIFLKDGWQGSVILPPDTKTEKMRYIFGSCPFAEKISKKIINLPTSPRISERDAKRIVNFLNEI